MGYYSWLTAENAQFEPQGIVPGTAVKILIPAEYGGGYVASRYGDYGTFFTSNAYEVDTNRVVPTCLLPGEKWYHSIDVFEWLAAWNYDCVPENYSYPGYTVDYTIPEGQQESFPVFSEKTLKLNRLAGSFIIPMKSEDVHIKYPLKFTRLGDTSTYEEVGASYPDFHRGVGRGWGFKRELKKLIRQDKQCTNPNIVLKDVIPGEPIAGRFAHDWYEYLGGAPTPQPKF